jgi:hypothetical protein
MKLDKETFVKHGFWFALGGFLLLWLVSMVVLKFVASDVVKKERDNYTGMVKSIDDIKNPKNETFLAPWKKYADAYEKEKEKVWKKAFESQNPPNRPDLWLMTWPSEDLARRHQYPEDPFELRELDEYKETVYPNQFKDLDKIVAPVVLAGGPEAIIPRVNWVKTPTPEEAWLAQEDFWVRRDLLLAVKGALDYVGRFQRIGKPETLPGDQVRIHFKNNTWEVMLLLEPFDGRMRVSGKSTIKNINHARRTLALGNAQAGAQGLGLRLTQAGATGATGFNFTVAGDPMAYGETREIKKPSNRIDSINIKLPEAIGLEQVFDLTTSPIKQINRLELAYNSHRTAKWPLKIWEVFKPKEDENADSQSGSAQASSMATMMSEMRGKMGGPEGGPGMMGMGSGNLTPHGLRRDRYLQANAYVRSMPIALVLVVDQSHIQDVETALLNSRLRIQITQESWVRAHNFHPGSEGGAFAGGGEMRGGAMGGTMGGMMGMMQRMRGGMGAPGGPAAGIGAGVGIRPGSAPARTEREPGIMGRGAGGISTPAGGMGKIKGLNTGGIGPDGLGTGLSETGTFEQPDDPNLVELTIYGIASIYERYPPNPKKKDEAPK